MRRPGVKLAARLAAALLGAAACVAASARATPTDTADEARACARPRQVAKHFINTNYTNY